MDNSEVVSTKIWINSVGGNRKGGCPDGHPPFVPCCKDYCSVPFSAALIMFSLAEM
jgi:hypothetical protein